MNNVASPESGDDGSSSDDPDDHVPIGALSGTAMPEDDDGSGSGSDDPDDHVPIGALSENRQVRKNAQSCITGIPLRIRG